MADLAESKQALEIHSHAGLYKALFENDAFARLKAQSSSNVHFLVDAKVARLYASELAPVLKAPSLLLIDATEENKSLDKFSGYVEHLIAKGVRRGDALVAVGGGIIQDITCFLSATLLRGLDWHFYPTTLLAQADSCIGSKSSVNVGAAKNVLGTFTPPREITICTRFLDTLEPRDLRSGIGEMLKVHVIEGPESFDRIAADYDKLLKDKAVLEHYIRRSLEIKKRIVETDEFDRGPRNVMNYGHTFGHAIESATQFAIPHGIAITLGMDMANFAAARLGLTSQAHYQRMHPALAANYQGYENHEVPLPAFLSAIAKDKKNTKDKIGLILPDASAKVARCFVDNDAAFHGLCSEYLENGRVRR